MNKYYLSSISMFVLLVLLLPTVSYGWDGTKSLTVTVYNQGLALINEVRQMDLPQGQGRVEFTGVPETIEAPSLQVKSITSPGKFNVLDMNYEYDLVSVESLLNRYVGKTVKVVLPDSRDADGRIVKKAKLLANNGAPIFEVDGGIYVGPYESVRLPEMPEGLRPRPTLVWLLDNKGPAKQDIDVSYLARQFSWQADYVLKLNRDNDKASISGWVTLKNHSGMAFNNANLKLVAGNVNQAAPRRNVYMTKGAPQVAEMAMDEAVQEEEFFEYHLYNVKRRVDVANKQTKQISLLQAPELDVEKQLISRFSSHFMRSSPVPIKQPVNVFLKFKNSQDNGLGIPLPKGVVRAYQESLDKSTLFVGEDRIKHTPKDAEVSLRLGEAFDVKVERTLSDSRKTGKSSFELSWMIEIKNSKDRPQKIMLQDFMPGDWKILDSSHKYSKLNADNIQFELEVPPSKGGKGLKVTYRVAVRH